MNYEKLGRLVEEYIKENPIETQECYYPEDWASRDSRNDIKEEIISFIKECECKV